MLIQADAFIRQNIVYGSQLLASCQMEEVEHQNYLLFWKLPNGRERAAELFAILEVAK